MRAAPIPAIPGGWVPVPRQLLERVGRLLSRVERAIVDLVLLRTVADDVHGRPESVTISEADFAEFAGATVDGVHRGLVRLEAKFRILESSAAGRSKRYRLAIEKAADCGAPTHRRLRKPPQREEVARSVPVSSGLPETGIVSASAIVDKTAALAATVLKPGSAPLTIPITASVRSIQIANRSSTPFAFHQVWTADALELLLTASGSTTAEPVGTVDEFRRFLLEFLPTLHCGPREQDVSALVDAAGGAVSIGQLRSYVRRRIRGGLAITGYGIFAKLATDCRESARAWVDAHAPPTVGAPRDPREQLLELAAAVEGAGPAFAEIVEDLQRLAEGAAGDHQEELEAIDDRLDAIAREVAGDRLTQLRRELKPELAPYRERLTRAQFAALEGRMFDRRVREALRLPIFDVRT